MKKEFEFPELSVYLFSANDIITTSMPDSGNTGDNNDEFGETVV